MIRNSCYSLFGMGEGNEFNVLGGDHMTSVVDFVFESAAYNFITFISSSSLEISEFFQQGLGD